MMHGVRDMFILDTDRLKSMFRGAYVWTVIKHASVQKINGESLESDLVLSVHFGII